MATIAEKLAEAAVTDNLNRTENPIGAPWVKMNPATSAGKCQASAPVGYTPATAFVTGEDDCYWSTSAFSSSASQYIYAIFTLNRIGSTERQTGVWLCRDEASPVTTQNGYLLRLEKKAGANEIKFTIEKWTGGAAEVIKELTTTSFIVGSKIALVVGNSKAYLFASTTEGGTFEEQMSVATATYTKGFSGMRAKGTGEFIIKDFRTGTFTLGEEKAPEVTTEAASEVGTASAKLNGQVDPNNAATTYYYRYLRSEAEFVKPGGGTGLPLCSDGTWIYFINNSKGYVGRVKLDGSELNSEWVKISTASFGGMACNSTHIFFIDGNTGHLARMKNDGTELNKEFIKEVGPEPGGVAVNATHIFWTREENIGRATISGTEKTNEFAKATGRGLDIQVTATNIYWLSPFGWIGRCALAGTGVEKEWVKSVESNGGLVVDTDAIYWANSTQDALGRCNIDGTSKENTWLPGACDNCRKLCMGGEALFAGGVGASVPRISRHQFLFQPGAKNASAGSGENGVSSPQVAESLVSSTRYNFQVIATNAKGTARGSWLNFTTAAAGKFVNVKVGSEVKSVKRWVLVNGELKSI